MVNVGIETLWMPELSVHGHLVDQKLVNHRRKVELLVCIRKSGRRSALVALVDLVLDVKDHFLGSIQDHIACIHVILEHERNAMVCSELRYLVIVIVRFKKIAVICPISGKRLFRIHLIWIRYIQSVLVDLDLLAEIIVADMHAVIYYLHKLSMNLPWSAV